MRVEIASDARRDLGLIFSHLADTHEGQGADPDEAAALARRRLSDIADALERLGDVPHQGTRHDDLMEGLRHVTKGRAVIWFRVRAEVVQVLGVFWGGQDDRRRMLVRLLGG